MDKTPNSNDGERRDLNPLPTFDSGGTMVDISNREALYDLMDDFSLYRTENLDKGGDGVDES
jgi:hypothetical protein